MPIQPLWTIQELIQLAKEDLELYDLPATVSDEDIINRLTQSALKDFSIVYPRREKFNLSYIDLVNPTHQFRRAKGLEYNIPKHFIMMYTPIMLIDCEPYTHRDFYGDVQPFGLQYDPLQLMEDVSMIKGISAMGQNLGHAPTAHFDSTRATITIYNSYAEGTYEITMGVMHDINLRTIPVTAMHTFRQLATYDIGAFLCSKLLRKDGVNTPAGDIQLNIEKLKECKGKYDELMKDLSDECVLDNETIELF